MSGEFEIWNIRTCWNGSSYFSSVGISWTRIPRMEPVVMFSRRMTPRDGVWWSDSVLKELLSFLYGSVEPYFWQKKRKREFLNFYKNRKNEILWNSIFSIFVFLNFSIIPPSKKNFFWSSGNRWRELFPSRRPPDKKGIKTKGISGRRPSFWRNQ